MSPNGKIALHDDPPPYEAGGPSTSKKGEGEVERGAWGGQIEFILTMVGYAVGLGNVWRFPYLVFRNGGASFLIPYFIMLAFVGLPIFYLEVSYGQFASLGPVTIWKSTPIWKGLGFASVSVSWLIGLYYNIVIAYAFYFFFASMTDNLPWTDCLNDWNECNCIESDELRGYMDNPTLNDTIALEERINTCELLDSPADFVSPADQFFYTEVVKLSPKGMDDMGGVIWELALCLLLSYIIIFIVLLKGIGSLGKVMYVVTIFPYVMMTILLINGATLDGAGDGIKFYLEPDWDRLSDGTVWADAATQIFYSLSACSGGLIAMSSYNQFKNNCARDSLMVPLINCGTSFYAGFVVFATLGFMAKEKGLPIEDVAEAGPGLVFIVYPEAISQMPVPQLWAILFFLMLIFLGFSSEFSIIETLFVTVMDMFPHILRANKYRPVIFRAVSITVFYLITLPMVTRGGFYLFNLTDAFISGYPLLFIGMFECIALQWVYGYNRFAEDIKLMLGKKPFILVRICWILVTPGALLAVIIFKSATYEDPTAPGYVYSDWTLALGWMMVSFTMFWIPVMALVEIFLQWKNAESLPDAVKKAVKPTEDWGPADAANRKGIYKSAPKEQQVYSVDGQTNKAFEMT